MAVQNAMDSGAIGRDNLTFHEGMLSPVASELRKLQPYGCNKLTRQNVLKLRIKDVLRNVSYLIKDLIF